MAQAQARGGCVGILFIIGILAVECWFALKVAEWLGEAGEPEYLGAVLALVVLSIVGYKLARWRAGRIPQAMLSGNPGPMLVGMFGAVLLAIPGFLSGAVGLVLQLPPLQRLFGRVASLIMARLVQRAMKQMGGKMPGGGQFPGGFPGGGPFPGMQPDDRVGGAGRGKTVDTTAERIDD